MKSLYFVTKGLPIITAFMVLLISIIISLLNWLMPLKETPIMIKKTNSDITNLLQGQWGYMPGVKKQSDGLLIYPTNLTIVEQNGKVAQSNPPINLYGTHIENLSGDFSVTVVIYPKTSTVLSIQLYGQIPVIADEFRIEKPSLQLKINRNQLVVSMWDGKSQKPAAEKSFQFTKQDRLELTVSKQRGLVTFAINNTELGSASELNIFSSGNIWFGLDSQKGEWILQSLRVAKSSQNEFKVVDSSTLKISKLDPSGLQKLAAQKRPSFLVGSAMALGPLVSDSEYAKVVLDKNTFGSITPENQLKMINLQPIKGLYTFEQADALVDVAIRNGLTIHGHTLVFGEANPNWFNSLPIKTDQDKAAIKAIMENHITTVINHFGNKINSWDVINEPLSDYDQFESGQVFRTHKWFQAMGEGYILQALRTAHTANPKALLFINEFGLEEDGQRWETFVAILNKLKPQLVAANIPIQQIGVGFQSHVYERGDQIDPTILKKHIQQLAKLGFISQISEMDVYSDDGDTVQSDQYTKVFNACLTESSCVAWRTWILSDRYNYWKDDDGTIYQGKDGLFDTSMQPRPAITAIQNSLK